MPRIYVGTAGWTIPREHAGGFPVAGSHLQRYAGVLTAVEINSTFYRRHQPLTFLRWASAVHPDFRFAVKMPRAITHEAKLAAPRRLLAEFFDDIRFLDGRCGPILVQLPPSLAFDRRIGPAFFRCLRTLYAGPVAFEPRHASWYGPPVDSLLLAHRIARVVADPPRPPEARTSGGDPSLLYLRLHGSPRMYFSPYGPARVATLAVSLSQADHHADVWCIFDNTGFGAAAGDALDLQRLMKA